MLREFLQTASFSHALGASGACATFIELIVTPTLAIWISPDLAKWLRSIKVNSNGVSLYLICYESPYRLSAFDKAFSQAVVLAHGSQYLKNASYEFRYNPASSFYWPNEHVSEMVCRVKHSFIIIMGLQNQLPNPNRRPISGGAGGEERGCHSGTQPVHHARRKCNRCKVFDCHNVSWA